MRRLLRILLNAATVLSLLVCLTLVLLWDRSFNGDFGRTFIRHGVAWHIACRAGDVQIDNAPQREAEARQIERDRLPIERALDREPYGSPAYRQARAEMERFEADAARRMLFATPLVEHVIPLAPILACSAILPGAWLARLAYRRRRAWVGLFRGRAAFVRLPWLALGAAMIVLWLRSHLMIQDQPVYNIRSPAQRRTAAVQLWSLRGQVLLGWGERVYTRQFDFDYEDPANKSNRLAANSVFPTRLGLNYFNRHLPRTQPQGSFWQRHGFSFQWPEHFTTPTGTAPSTMAYAHVSVPHWLLLTFWSIPLIVWHRRCLRASRRARLGLCGACAYDLQGNTSGICPECGTPTVTLTSKPPSTNPFNTILWHPVQLDYQVHERAPGQILLESDSQRHTLTFPLTPRWFPLRSYRRYGHLPRQLSLDVGKRTLSHRAQHTPRCREWPVSDIRSARISPLRNLLGRPAGGTLSIRLGRWPIWIGIRCRQSDLPQVRAFAQQLFRQLPPNLQRRD